MSTKIKIAARGQGKRLVGLGAVAFILIGGLMLYATLTTYIKPDELAVRQIYLGPNKGIQEDIYGPGLHFVMPGYERLHTFPRDIQLLEFNEGVSASEDAVVSNPIRIQTSEGYNVTVDVTIAYRIVDPFTLIREIGPGDLYKTSVMIPRSDKFLRQNLGRLNAEEFYQGERRLKAADQARQQLGEDVEELGIEIWHLMVRHYTYDQRYQDAIEQRKIQDQTVFKNRAEAVAASREAEKNRVLAEGTALIEVEKERGRAEVTKITAEGDLYYRQKVSEGELLVSLAEAKGTRLENNALQVSGASNMVGLEMAEVLNGAQVIVVPTDGDGGVNPLDLDQLIRGW
ncbi:MAG: SPFH domain-containing protein [Myxococcota bacterium]|nr:SPFH domain-containing protein [Myxococcota bacterium]